MSDLDFARLHDAELICIEVDRWNERARLTLKPEGGQTRVVMELIGLQAFRAEDVTMQNVVSRLLRSSHGQIASDNLDHWLSWATSFSDTSSWLTDESRRKWLAACAVGDLDLVLLVPSAGAQVAAICERVSLR